MLTYQKSNNSFSTLNFKINPWFLTGFTDAEGSFIIKIHSNEQLKTKWRVRPVFSITLHVKDLSLLENIQKTLGVGKISKRPVAGWTISSSGVLCWWEPIFFSGVTGKELIKFL